MADFGINALAYGSARVSQADTWTLNPENTWTRVDGAGFTVSNSARSLVIILNEIPTARPFIQTSNVDNMEVTDIYYNNGQFTIGVHVDDENVWRNLVNSGSAAALHFLIYEPAVPTNTLTTLIDDLTTRVTELENSNQSVPGTGDLCSLLSADSGYQMFRNGLTMQWMSDNFTQEGSRVINFPIAFAAKPFKVVASIRHEGKMPEDTQQWMHVVNWTKDYVTVYCQSHNATEFEIGVDIIAIGIAEVVNCPNSEGSSGTKISNLKKAESLEDSDLFVVSKEVDGDTVYDTSNNVTMSSLTESIKTRIEPTIEEFSSNITFIDPVIIYSHSGFVTFNWTTKDLSAHIPEGATGCIINITYSLNGPDDNIPAKTFLRAKNGAPVYTAIYAGAWGDGDEIGGNSQGLYPINVETRSIDISIPSRSPRSQNVYLIGYF